jgi:hypothetical protein
MRFQPGQSGNPAGRPAGALNKKTLAVEAAMAERAEEIVNNVMDRAKNGESAAMRLTMDRLAPTGAQPTDCHRTAGDQDPGGRGSGARRGHRRACRREPDHWRGFRPDFL